ncbi:uncharacterized protein LY79DRAFT_535149 [Colletotrichum navitas]|uniref:Uncharacterized protein n=1 Tax=Colletotrichum navitas TaxID=681940 RepID=A0AAD8QCG0_9PEZI|nr:uncharacterized protein LY79DRAFT_535149 [Colletotrichum navitas]KAK1599456.1 hypothetical protein LY79DRAFT_535149 [Colletotrichum navitas]
MFARQVPRRTSPWALYSPPFHAEQESRNQRGSGIAGNFFLAPPPPVSASRIDKYNPYAILGATPVKSYWLCRSRPREVLEHLFGLRCLTLAHRSVQRQNSTQGVNEGEDDDCQHAADCCYEYRQTAAVNRPFLRRRLALSIEHECEKALVTIRPQGTHTTTPPSVSE